MFKRQLLTCSLRRNRVRIARRLQNPNQRKRKWRPGRPASQLAAAVTGKFCLLSSLPVTAGRRHLMRTSHIIAVDKSRTLSLCLCHSVVCFLNVRVLHYALWAESVFAGDENDDDGSHNCDDDYFLDSRKCSLLFSCVFLFVCFWLVVF